MNNYTKHDSDTLLTEITNEYIDTSTYIDINSFNKPQWATATAISSSPYITYAPYTSYTYPNYNTTLIVTDDRIEEEVNKRLSDTFVKIGKQISEKMGFGLGKLIYEIFIEFKKNLNRHYIDIFIEGSKDQPLLSIDNLKNIISEVSGMYVYDIKVSTESVNNYRITLVSKNLDDIADKVKGILE